ncbi:MAG: hypothetical protein GVY18_18710 [Bacteroidetes bacterium]|jgi:hypothetical protein|nr:hypothetical protein [Bacteroidota bacterium]
MPLSREEILTLIELGRIDALLEGDALERLRVELKDLLLTTWDARTRQALTDAVRRLESAGGALLAAEDVEEALAPLARQLGARFGAEVTPGLLATIEGSYELAQLGVYDQVPAITARPSFNLVDEKAIRWLHEYEGYFVRNHYDRLLQEDVQRIGSRVLREGLTRREAGQAFRRELGQRLGQSQSYWEGFADSALTRAQEFGRVEAYQKAGVTAARIVAVRDDRTSDICNFLHGKTVPVEVMAAQRDDLLATSDPEAVKGVAPWLTVDEARRAVDGDTVTDPRLATPPYHFNCRTRSVAITD